MEITDRKETGETFWGDGNDLYQDQGGSNVVCIPFV